MHRYGRGFLKRADGGGYMIELRNVSKIFKTKESEVKALDDVSLKIEDGDKIGRAHV